MNNQNIQAMLPSDRELLEAAAKAIKLPDLSRNELVAVLHSGQLMTVSDCLYKAEEMGPYLDRIRLEAIEAYKASLKPVCWLGKYTGPHIEARMRHAHSEYDVNEPNSPATHGWSASFPVYTLEHSK